jgi:ribosomal protein S12 methylthiotransferase accessory factor
MREIVLKNVSPLDLQSTLEKMAVVVDPVCGIVRSILPNWLEQGDAHIFAFGAISCQASPLTIGPQIVHAGGAAVERGQALAATIGEAIERYCSAYCDPDEFIYGSYIDMKSDAVNPADFCLYSKRQYESPGFPFTPFTSDAELTWTWGFSLQHKKPVLIPASLTYLPLYIYEWNREADIGSAVSTGLACGNTIEEATLSAISEVVERDSLACFWLNRLPPRRVAIDESSSLFETFTKHLATPGLQYYTCDITTDLGIPTFFTLLVGGSNYGVMVNAGSQASLSPVKAALKSLVEAAHGRPYVRFIISSRPNWEYRPDFSSVNTFQDHASFYTRAPQHQDALSFITDSEPVKKLSEVSDLSTGSVLGDIETYLTLLAKHGLDVIVKDMTTPDIEDVGLKVVRVLIPGVQQLHGDHRFPYLGCPRLYRMRQALGFGDELVMEEDLNPFPHPLP